MIQFSPFMFVSATVIGSLSAYLANKRGHNPYLWFSIGFLFGIFGIFAIFFVPGKKKKVQPPIVQQPVYTIQGPKDKFWYFLDSTNEQQGPMSHDRLTTAWKEGKINGSTYVWNEEMSDWKLLKEILKGE